MYSYLLPLLPLLQVANCVNFPFESIQLTDADVGNFSSIAFGDASKTPTAFTNASCRTYPGTSDWPIDYEWQLLNGSLDGALLKPSPPAAVCYPGPLQNTDQCNFLFFNASRTRFYIDDPLTVLTTWPQGDTCSATPFRTANATCTQGGFPTYVVNATTVKQIQIAVNFARNKNIRLVIKNTGHDFVGRSTGGGSLSIWTHHLKNFAFLPEHTQGPYSDIAAKVGAGLEAWELYQYMDDYNMTLVVPGGSTVGAYGGWMLGGGHSTLASKYGLGADQPLSLQVVTADGRFIVASPEENEDLFYALRGGGPGTFGIVTSAIVKAYPPIQVTETSIAFMGGNYTTPAFNFTGGFGNFTPPPSNFSFPAPVVVQDLNKFWEGVNAFFKYGAKVVDNGGTTYSYVSQLSNTSYSFTTTIDLPDYTSAELNSFIEPLNSALHSIGIPANSTSPTSSLSWGSSRHGEGDTPGSARFASRLFPRSNWDDDTKFNATMAAIRQTIEAGYSFHGIHMSPTVALAGYPGDNGVNPAFRNTVMHADSFDSFSMVGSRLSPFLTPSVQSRKDAEARHNSYMNMIREVTPEGGSYINEADVQEPNWQESFFGSNYGKLSELKEKWDPWHLFWAPTTVGSEGWEVRTADGLPTQNGRLCRVAK